MTELQTAKQVKKLSIFWASYRQINKNQRIVRLSESIYKQRTW